MHKRCQHPGGCRSLPTYGRQGERAQFCANHAPEGTEDVVHKRCEHPGGCMTVPSYGIPREKARFCAKHALEGMVYVNKQAK